MATDNPTDTEEPVEESTEARRVRRWRRDTFRKLGCTDATADLLADCPYVDLHDATRMIDDGHCPPELAARILL